MVLALFAYLLYRLFFIAQNAPDLFGSMLVSGVFIHIALQVIMNVAVVLNLMSEHRCYPALYQLWRNLGFVPDGRDGTGPQRGETDLNSRNRNLYYNSLDKCATRYILSAVYEIRRKRSREPGCEIM